MEEINISLGFQCTTSEVLKKTNKRFHSYPFDWILSNPKGIYELIVKLLISHDIKDFVKNEFLKIDGYVFLTKAEEFFISKSQTNMLYNSKYNLIFPHEENNLVTIIDKYTRRFSRLKDMLLDNTKFVNFIFINRMSTNMSFKINNNNILEGCEEYLNQIYNLLNEIRTNFSINIITPNVNIIDIDKLDNNIKTILIKPNNAVSLTDEEIIPHLKR
jgi:hypothetical protein